MCNQVCGKEYSQKLQKFDEQMILEITENAGFVAFLYVPPMGQLLNN